MKATRGTLRAISWIFLFCTFLLAGFSASAADWNPKFQVTTTSSGNYYLTVRAYGPGPEGDGTGGYNQRTTNASVIKSLAFEVLATDGSVVKKYDGSAVDWYGISWAAGLDGVATGALVRLTATTNDGKIARTKSFKYLVQQPVLDGGTSPMLALTPSTVSMTSAQKTTFTAKVTNGNGATVIWSVVETGCGSVSGGQYTAPTTTTVKTCHVKAALSGTTVSATATVTVNPVSQNPTLTLTPLAYTIASGEKTTFTATVTNGGGASIIWSIQETDCGAVNGGQYTAPTVTASKVCHVNAALSGTAVSATATVTVNPAGATVARPGYNLSTGFFVLGSKLYDANGIEFRIRGVNANHWWGNASDNEKGIGYIKATKANTARVVFGPDPDHLGYLCQTTAERRMVVSKYIDHKIVPVVEYHNATGSNDPALVDQAVDLWIGEPWVKEFEKYVVVNITNEWATQGNETLWKDTYIKAIQKLRAAGVNNTLVIDSINWGQGTSALLQYGKAVFDADPQKNVVFSLHMYAGWLAPTDPTPEDDYHHRIDLALPKLMALGLPLIVGEFNHEVGSMADSTLIDELEKRNVGWIGWMFFNSDGNIENMMDSIAQPRAMTDFGATLIGYFAAKAQEATVFGPAPVPSLPSLPPHVVIDPNRTWNPGPVTLSNVANWWLEASIAQNIPNLYRIDFEKPDGSLVKMAGWGPNNYSLSIDFSSYINQQNVRFWLYSTEGAVAKTNFGKPYAGAILSIAE